MAILRMLKIEEQIIPAHEVEEKVCDICGADATGRAHCDICKKDLCPDHQIDVWRIYSGRYRREEEFHGFYCKECLIAEIKKRFK